MNVCIANILATSARVNLQIDYWTADSRQTKRKTHPKTQEKDAHKVSYGLHTKSLKTLSGYIPLLLTCAFSDPMDNCVPTDVDFNRALCIPTECIPTGEFVWVPVDIL